ncbi:hypothetical protein C7444_11534 [Sphaerotilus hippei]|uniref:Lon N-terminal domain-containing protein n=1 Tax=Sphaerotilus hippei TaxID=744406 RepID=A0A318GZA1_9BURK|nr:LON peptidase substrate-binding domain-containing protein [Sphaerotilus hippei]PXW94141.1 hypothetical protein C7444_11534 [Sphaerotilus hippei]
MSAPALPSELALFPLHTVLFPQGQLGLQIFEARYLDLMAHCLRHGEGFGVVTLIQGSEVRRSDEPMSCEPVGCLARLISCDSEQAGLLHVRCRGSQRFELSSSPRQERDGLWRAGVSWLDDDPPVRPADEVRSTVEALRTTVDTLAAQGSEPFLSPWHYDDAGWVANRWSELLPLPAATKQRLMALRDPGARLALVHGFLRRQQIIAASAGDA